MSWRSNDQAWGGVTRALHWLISISVITLLIVGAVMTSMANTPDKFKVYLLHKSFGLTVLALMLIRLIWRLFFDGRRPPMPDNMPGWQKAAAHALHLALYALLIAMPLSGWLFNSAANFPLKWFNLVTLPSLSGPDPALKALAGAAHYWMAWLIAAVVLVHAAAAIKHHLVDRDDTLSRMLLGRGRAPSPAKAPAPLPASLTITAPTPLDTAAPAPTPIDPTKP